MVLVNAPEQNGSPSKFAEQGKLPIRNKEDQAPSSEHFPTLEPAMFDLTCKSHVINGGTKGF